MDFGDKKCEKLQKMSKINEIGRKKMQKLHFLEMRFLRFFGLLENEKNRIIKNVKISSNDRIFLSRHIKEWC